MGFYLENDFRELYITDSATTVSSAQISEAFFDAEEILLDLVGEAIILEAKSETPQNAKRAERIKRAHGKLAFRAMLILRSSRLRDGGIVGSERDVNNSVTTSYIAADEVEKRREQLYSDALNLISEYVVKVETVVETAPSYSTTVSRNLTW